MTRGREPARTPRAPRSGSRAAAPPSAPPAARSGAARGPAGRTAPPRRRRGGPFRGDRPYQLGLLLLVVPLAALALGPLEEYSVAADRVDGLQAQRAELDAEVDRLEERRAALSDPAEIELLARREHGLVRPGEQPFVVVTPEEPLSLGPDADADADVPADAPWYRRLGRELTALFR